MRFAFYERVSTEDNQDPEASRNGQLAQARSTSRCIPSRG
jgi:site-specific DNA recombinase